MNLSEELASLILITLTKDNTKRIERLKPSLKEPLTSLILWKEAEHKSKATKRSLQKTRIKHKDSIGCITLRRKANEQVESKTNKQTFRGCLLINTIIQRTENTINRKDS